jgi:hypothetical protein
MSIPSQLPQAAKPFEITVRTQSECTLQLKCYTKDEKVVKFTSDYFSKNTKFLVSMPENTNFVSTKLGALKGPSWEYPCDSKGIELKGCDTVRETVSFHAFQTLTLSPK